MHIVVANLGSAAAGAFDVDVGGTRQRSSGLGVGATGAFSISGSGLPSNLVATVDPASEVQETNENNNQSSVPFPTGTPPPTCTPTPTVAPITGATLTANPNAIPAGMALETTTISWNTGDGALGQIYVATDRGGEVLFAEGATGSQEAPWIASGFSYVFRLYWGTAREAWLAEATVTRPATQTDVYASPNPVPAGPGLGTTTITWTTGDGSEGEVWVSTSGGPEALFATGSSGSQEAPWILGGRSYLFCLRRPANPAVCHSLPVSRLVNDPTLTASPNPVPAGSGAGTTTISWNIGDGWSIGQVYVSMDGGDEVLFSQGESGSQEASWILTVSEYAFRLYELEGALLVAVTVTRAT